MPINVLIKTDQMPRQMWLKERRRGIGGSDIAGVVGMSPWSSPIKVYQAKIGELPDIPETEAMHFGTELEAFVAKEFERQTGLRVRKRNAILYHSKQEKWMLANVDRLVIGRHEGLECKTTNAFSADKWSEEKVPDQYFLQCQWYMGVTGYPRWHIAVLIGGQHFLHRVIERDDELIAQLMEKGRDFWFNHVVPRIPPEFDGSRSSAELLSYMYPEGRPETVNLPNRFADELKRHDEIVEQINKLKTEKAAIENRIKAQMKEAEVAQVQGRTVTWKTINCTRFDQSQFKRDHSELYVDYLKSKPQRKFLVKKMPDMAVEGK
jgi:putative phage-type endonuclease